jgi:hypothetical protein
MTKITMLTTAAAAALLVTLAAALWPSHASTAEPTPERPTAGRYQLLVRDEFDGGREVGEVVGRPYLARNRLVLLDTATGQCWMRDDKEKKWDDLGNPTKPK